MVPSPEHPVTIVAGDVNNLKLTNDVFGHAAGDYLLTSINNTTQTIITSVDTLLFEEDFLKNYDRARIVKFSLENWHKCGYNK